MRSNASPRRRHLSCVVHRLWSMRPLRCPHQLAGLPARDLCGVSDPQKWGGSPRAATHAGEPSPAPYQRPKTGGSLTPPASPLVRRVQRDRQGGGMRGAASQSCTAAAAGHPLIPRPMGSFGELLHHNGEGLLPLREKPWRCPTHAPPPRATPPFSVARSYHGTSLTPGGENR